MSLQSYGFRISPFPGNTKLITTKMAYLALALFLLAVTTLSGSPPVAAAAGIRELFANKGANGGVTCAGCTIVVGLAEQLTQVYNVSVSKAVSVLCNFLPAGFREGCILLVDEFGPAVVELLEEKATPDIVCMGIELCTKEKGEDVCHLFPLPSGTPKSREEVNRKIERAIKTATYSRKRAFRFPDLCNISVIKPICKLIERFGNDHLPLEDFDGDDFSDVHTFRGTAWRGKDCNDFDADVYPGRHTTDDAVFDSNCNGIYGVDPATGKTYESLWCEGTGQMGIALLGDSAGAHFHIPPAWLTSKNLSVDAFQDLLFILENEFDWPMLSSTTGYKNSTWPKSISGPVDSGYLRLRELNRCVHRDYQNIGVNGARSSAMADRIVKSFSRHGTKDNPVLLTFALIGNDVCNGHHDMDHMTTPEEFYANNLRTFQYVDPLVAPGSKLIAMGLADGRVLYNTLHNRTHPIGSLHNDVTYTQFYDYLNCLEVSPCFGWMNSNETWRNRTTERAMQLNAALRDLVANVTFKNMEAHYFDPPIELGFKRWEERGGKPWQLIEPVDGFHPNQQSNAINSEIMWELLQNYTDFIPPTNPYNHLIEKRFGDQGGY